jgi:hypothetical protein
MKSILFIMEKFTIIALSKAIIGRIVKFSMSRGFDSAPYSLIQRELDLRLNKKIATSHGFSH